MAQATPAEGTCWLNGQSRRPCMGSGPAGRAHQGRPRARRIDRHRPRRVPCRATRIFALF